MANSIINIKRQAQPVRILRLWHGAVVSEYRKKIQMIASHSDLDLTLLIPHAWKEGGRKVCYRPVPEIDTGYRIRTAHILHANNIRRYIFLNGLWSTLASFQPEIIDMEEEPFSAVVSQVLRYCRLLKLNSRFIFHSAHNIETSFPDPFRRWERRALARCHAAIVRNAEAGDRLRKLGFQGLISRTGNGLDLNFFTPGKPSGPARLPISGKQFVIGFAGKLRPGKGVPDLVKALYLLPDETTLYLAGDGELKPELEQLSAGDTALRGRIVLAGPVQHEKMVDYYRKLNILVLPSRTEKGWKESFGRVLIEAMACGIPVIGSDSGSIPSTIQNAGLIFHEGDAEDLAQKILQVMKSAKTRNRMIRDGLKRSRDFSWESVANVHFEAYRMLTGLS